MKKQEFIDKLNTFPIKIYLVFKLHILSESYINSLKIKFLLRSFALINKHENIFLIKCIFLTFLYLKYLFFNIFEFQCRASIANNDWLYRNFAYF